MALLQIDDLVAGYGDVDILHGVEMRVEAGEIVCVIGPNGAGKSTLMKAVFGLITIRSGQILFRDQVISGLDPALIVRRGMSYVPQTDNVFPSLTVEENLEMGAFLREGDLRGQ